MTTLPAQPDDCPAPEPQPVNTDGAASALPDSPPAQAKPPPAPPQPPFAPAAAQPTQLHESGIRYDFNEGCRVLLPPGDWQVRLADSDTGNILFETRIGSGAVSSRKRYYVRHCLTVWRINDGAEPALVLQHDYCAQNRKVLVQFQQQHQCQLSCAMAERLIPLFKDAYPDIDFIGHGQVQPEQFYATYYLGLFYDDADNIQQPCDFRLVGLHRTAGHLLGVDPEEQPPRIHLPDHSRPIAEPYVCIATQSTAQCKYWNNPVGWRELIAQLKQQGYRVICIDQKALHGHGLVWNHLPHGAEDQTGDQPLQQRARWLKHADFFVGLSSGLSWLAWAMGIPVVMISGFTHPRNEFYTPYRVINYHTCNSCWHDVRLRYDPKDFLWCPRQQGTPRQFECTRLITVPQVWQTINHIPSFMARNPSL